MSEKRKTIAYFSPFPPIQSGISAYSQGLLHMLSKNFDITLVIDGYTPESSSLPTNVAWQDFQTINDLSVFLKSFDEILYHVGNNRYHEYIYKTLHQFPGIVVMHDYSVHNMLTRFTLNDGKIEPYLEALKACGVELSGNLDTLVKEKNYTSIKFMWEERSMNYPLNESIVSVSHAVIVHSEFVHHLMQQRVPSARIFVIPLYADDFSDYVDSDQNTCVIGCFGLKAPHKRLEIVMSVFSDLCKNLPQPLQLWLVGGMISKDYEQKLHQIADNLSISQDVVFRDYVSDEEYFDLLKKVTICINLRYPTFGENSISLSQMLAFSKPCIVTDIGSFHELPDEVVVKIPPPDQGEKKELKKSLTKLVLDKNLREFYGRHAYKYAFAHCHIEQITHRYTDILLNTIFYRKIRENYINKFCSLFQEFHIDPKRGDVIFDSVASSFKDILP